MKKEKIISCLAIIGVVGTLLVVNYNAEDMHPRKNYQVGIRDTSIEIGVSLYGMKNDSEKYFIESIIQESNRLGLGSQIFEGESNSSNQISHVQELIDQKVNGIILSPYNEDVAQECIQMAMDAGMPVVLVDSETDYWGASGYIAHDLKNAGYILVHELGKQLGGKGNVVILEDVLGLTTQQQKRAGIDEGLLEYPDLKVISYNSANGLEIEANAIVSKWLIQFDRIDAIICENDEMALGALQALQHAEQEVLIGSIGGTEEVAKAVEEGQIAVSVREDIQGKGQLALQTIIGIILGEDVNDEYILPITLMTHKAE